jgi:hypothetical protein
MGLGRRVGSPSAEPSHFKSTAAEDPILTAPVTSTTVLVLPGLKCIVLVGAFVLVKSFNKFENNIGLFINVH